ncbi:MAG: FmdB family zinc ribbon protein [Acidimicrobiales bacterium]
MPVYEYACRTCESHFEIRRSMSDSSDPATCPHGHSDTRRVLSVFASVGRGSQTTPAPQAGPAGGCGAGCACAAGA